MVIISYGRTRLLVLGTVLHCAVLTPWSPEMERLWLFASSADSFECKDIEAALGEIQVSL